MVTAKEWLTRDWRIMSFFKPEDERARAKAIAAEQAKAERYNVESRKAAEKLLPDLIKQATDEYRNGKSGKTLLNPLRKVKSTMDVDYDYLAALLSKHTGYECEAGVDQGRYFYIHLP